MRLFNAMAIVLCLSYTAIGQILSVPDDYPTIQAAVYSAVTGDTVLVADGLYYENIKVAGESITLASHFIVDGDTSHIVATVIDGGQPADPDSASVVTFAGSDSSTSLLSGFTITGGSGTVIEDGGAKLRLGGGVFCNETSLRVEHNRIVGNRLTGTEVQVEGAGIAGQGDRPGPHLTLEDNLISHNEIDVDGWAIGGGVSLWMAATIRRNVITDNTIRSISGTSLGGGVSALSSSDSMLVAVIEDNQILSNRAEAVKQYYFAGGGGMVSQRLRVLIRGNTISDNTISIMTAGSGAGLMLGAVLDGSDLTGNTIQNNSVEKGDGRGGGIAVWGDQGILFDANRIVGNEAVTGGGIYLTDSYATIRRSVIAQNTALDGGGGIWIDNAFLHAPQGFGGQRPPSSAERILPHRSAAAYSSDEPSASKTDVHRVEVMNNSIVDNRAEGSLGGGGISALVGSPLIQNSILWGNEAAVDPQIRGAVVGAFNIVEGGLTGFGNLDVDPQFLNDTGYALGTSSPAIDAGNPDPKYNDVEDPSKTGMALLPALGTVRNDMGAAGGPEDPTVEATFLGPEFASFMERVELAPQSEKQGIVDSFLVATGSSPFIEDNNVVYFLYVGGASQVTVPGDANDWVDEAFPMTRVDGTLLWYREAVFESDARLDYKLLVDGSTWLVDPRNPRTIMGGFGPNSELAMPGFDHPEEINRVPGVPQGSITKFTFESDILNNSRVVEVYTPAGYERVAPDSLPIIYFHDGSDYTKLAGAPNILDNLIHQERITPVIAVFVPPQDDRGEEYAFSRAGLHERFVVEEMMPFIDSEFRTMKRAEMRAMSGPSFGGLITTQICYNHPEVFGKCAPVSPSYWPRDMEVFNTVANGPLVPVQWYFDWGAYEVGIAPLASALVANLLEKSAEKGAGLESVTWNEWHDGHSWGNWRAHVKEFLILFFPGRRATGMDEETIPANFALLPNYPNPFNPETTIGFRVPSPSHVTLRIFDVTGRLVAQLADRDFTPGEHELRWNAAGIASGVYLYRIEAEGFSEARTLVVLK